MRNLPLSVKGRLLGVRPRIKFGEEGEKIPSGYYLDIYVGDSSTTGKPQLVAISTPEKPDLDPSESPVIEANILGNSFVNKKGVLIEWFKMVDFSPVVVA